MTKTKLIAIATASAATKGTQFPVAPIDNRGQYKPDLMGLLAD